MDLKGLKQAELARITEYTGPAIKKITEGEAEPKFGFLAKILLAFPDLSADWLLTGRGEMTLKDKRPSGEKKETDQEITELMRFKIETLEKELKKCQESLFFEGKPVHRDS